MYQYAPLRDPDRQIRLARFNRDIELDPHRHLELVIFDREDTPTYNAISYTWGDPLEELVSIDEQFRSVRKNCVFALQQAYLHHPDDWMWVDSISINQEDLREKTKQVAIMWQIYESAYRVLACVGRAQDNSELIVNMSAQIDQSFEAQSNAEAWRPWLSRLGEQHTFNLREAFEAFATRAYWSRLWIVQEMAAAPRVWILCGYDFISWQALDLLCTLLGDVLQSVAQQQSWTTVKPVRATPLEAVILFETESELDIGYVFTNFGDFKCADPRDRLYGLLHLINWPQGIAPVLPDYTKSPFGLALKMAEMIELFRVEDMLAAFQVDAHHPNMLSLVQSRISSSRMVNDTATSSTSWKANYDPFSATPSDVDSLTEMTTTCARLLTRSATDMSLSDAASNRYNNISDHESRDPLQSSPASSVLRPSPVPTSTKLLVHGSNIIAEVCPESLGGDILVCFGQKHLGNFLVLRENAPGLYDVIGQAITLHAHRQLQSGDERYAFDAHVFEARVTIRLVPEDILVLSGQDLDLQVQKRLPSLRMKRLHTRPLLFPENAARLERA